MILRKKKHLFIFTIKSLLYLALFGNSIISYATTYYINHHSGLDTNSGLSEKAAWRTLTKVSNFKFIPGDYIYFKKGQKWEGTLSIPSSGTVEKPIVFGSYGNGINPIITRTVLFSDWKLIQNNGASKIWRGTIPGLKNSWGMIRQGIRVAKHRQYAKIKIDEIKNEHFYYPLNGQKFYYRYDAGHPGPVFVGKYEEAIQISNKHHIIIDGINAYGPGGKKTSGSSTGFSTVSIKNDSHHVTLKNMIVSHSNSFGISSDKTTENIIYDSLDVHDNGSTGIYMNSNEGKILNCKSYDNGRLTTDMGDRGGIGSYQGTNILIKKNEVYHNGPDNGYADLEVSIVGTGQVIIEKNHIHDCLQGCLQIAEGGDNSTIAYNIISHYGTTTGKGPSPGIYSGIRIGGGTGGAKNVKIVNNIIHGGQLPAKSNEAALYILWFDNSGLLVQNNIFSQNINKNIYVHKSTILDKSVFSNNIYSTITSDIGINFKENHIESLEQWKFKTNYGAGSYMAPALFVNQSSSFSLPADFQMQGTSIAIENGIAVGQDSDFIGTTILNNKSPDIGVFEHNIK